MSTKKQKEANRQNALKSTGPTSTAGKAIASSNALRHGVLSNKSILPDEFEAAFDELRDNLIETYKPEGLLELSLIDDIAQNIWRKQRLILAETTAIRINLTPRKIAESITSVLGCTNNPVTVSELQRTVEDHETWSESMLHELKKLDINNLPDWPDLDEFPYLNQHLLNLTQQPGNLISSYVNSIDPSSKNRAAGFFEIISNYCSAIHERRFEVLGLKMAMNSRNGILDEAIASKYSRYETRINNNIQKTSKLLNELITKRSKAIDAKIALNNTL